MEGRPGSIGGVQLADGAGFGGFFEESESGLYHLALSFGVVGRTHGAAHDVAGDESAGDVHALGVVAERADHHGNGGNPGGLECPGDMSHGHMADGSGGNKEGGVDLVFVEVGGDGRTEIGTDPKLGGGTHGGERLGSELAEAA